MLHWLMGAWLAPNRDLAPPSLVQDAEAHLQHHFESIQEIADSTTLPSLLLPANSDSPLPLTKLSIAIRINHI